MLLINVSCAAFFTHASLPVLFQKKHATNGSSPPQAMRLYGKLQVEIHAARHLLPNQRRPHTLHALARVSSGRQSLTAPQQHYIRCPRVSSSTACTLTLQRHWRATNECICCCFHVRILHVPYYEPATLNQSLLPDRSPYVHNHSTQ